MDGLLPPMLFIVFPAVGCGVAALLTWLAFRDARAEVGAPKAPPGQPDRAKGQLLVMMVIPATVVMFGLMGYLTVGLLADNPTDETMMAMGACLGLGGLFTALGQGVIARTAATDIVRNPKNFGRHLVVIVQCETAVMFSFITVMMSAIASPPPAGLVPANYIMSVASVGGLVSGILAAPIDPAQMGKRLVRTASGASLAALGFLAAVWLLRPA